MQLLRKSLTARLIIYFLSLSTITLTLIVSISFGNIRNTIINSVYERLEVTSTLKEEELNRWLKDKQDEVLSLSQKSDITRNMSNLTTYPENSGIYQRTLATLSEFLIAEGKGLTSFREISLISPTGGIVVTSTIPENIGQIRITESYYTQGRIRLNIQRVYVSMETGKPTMTIASPIFDSQGTMVGVIAAHLDLERLDSIVLQRTGLGATGESYLVDGDKNFMSPTRFGNREFPHGVSTVAIDTAMEGLDGQAMYENYDGTPVIGVYDWLDKWNMALITETSQQEALAPIRQLGYALLIAGILIAIGLALGTFMIARQITRPILNIRDTASLIAAGNLELEAPVITQDEIGTLAESFNRMTGQLRETLSGLEKRVAERTADLETARLLSERRANQLLSIGEISRTINSEQRLDILLPLITRLVSERFGNYHTGIFLIDETRLFAVLQAANSEGGGNMLKRGHRLEIGASGIVGYVTQTGTPRIALDVGRDAVYFDNPDLPNTRSEMALPLIFRGQIIGALDVQSEKPGAFTDDDMNILSILADQIAIAIENARLFAQTQQSISELQSLYGTKLQEGWRSFSHDEGLVGYYQSIGGGKPLTETVNTDEIQQAMNRGDLLIFHADGKTEEPVIVIPIKLRGHTIGVMRIKSVNKDRQWTNNEINLTEAVSERLSLALENARLIQESQRQALKEQAISEITGKIGSSINLQNVLLTAAEELGKSIPGSEIVIKFQNENMDGDSE
jgi:GAF domain-containing protein/HAMP domain-containing protein